MILAVDTNIFLDILRPNPQFSATSLRLLERSADEGVLVVCHQVYAELAANFPKQPDLDRFLQAAQVRIEPADRVALFTAGQRWRAYRRAGGKRERILPDFVIGAHALRQASKLLSRDRGFFSSYFGDLEVVSGSASE